MLLRKLKSEWSWQVSKTGMCVVHLLVWKLEPTRYQQYNYLAPPPHPGARKCLTIKPLPGEGATPGIINFPADYVQKERQKAV